MAETETTPRRFIKQEDEERARCLFRKMLSSHIENALQPLPGIIEAATADGDDSEGAGAAGAILEHARDHLGKALNDADETFEIFFRTVEKLREEERREAGEAFTICTWTLDRVLGDNVPPDEFKAIVRRFGGLGWRVMQYGKLRPAVVQDREPFRKLSEILQTSNKGLTRDLLWRIDAVHEWMFDARRLPQDERQAKKPYEPLELSETEGRGPAVEVRHA